MRNEYEEIIDIQHIIHIDDGEYFCNDLFTKDGNFNFIKEEEKGLELYLIKIENEEERVLKEEKKMFIPYSSILYIEYKEAEEIREEIPDLIYNHIISSILRK